MGKFITVEGSEGAGKTTAIEIMQQVLAQAHIPFILTREPGGTSLGEKLRALLLDTRNDDICTDTELLLMFAARMQHIETKIKPALEQGSWVLCDRFTDASYAYQGGGRGVSTERISQLELWVQKEFGPDLTLLLDIPVKIGLQRAAGRGELDRFEREQMQFFERVRAKYLERAKQFPERFRIIDAEQSMEAVHAQINTILRQYIKGTSD